MSDDITPDMLIRQARDPDNVTPDMLIEQAKENDDYIAELVEASKPSPDYSFFAKNLARTAGAVVDLANIPVGAEEPYGGSKNIERFLKAIGWRLPREDETPITYGGHIAGGGGDVLGAVIPATTLTRIVSRTGGTAGKIAKEMMRTTTEKPLRSLGYELAAGVGMGTGGYLARENFGDDPTAVAIGELLGGLAIPLLPTVAKNTPAGRVVRYGADRLKRDRKLREDLMPWAETGARPRAQDRLVSQTADLPRAMGEFEKPSVGQLSPAQRTGDRGLLALEKAVRKKNPQLDDVFAEQIDRSQDLLEQAIRDISTGDVADAVLFVESRRLRLMNALANRSRQAGRAAQERIARLTPDKQRADASKIVRQEIESALDDARLQETRLYSDVDNSVVVPLDATKENWKKTLLDRDPASDPADLPGFVKQWLGDSINNKTGDLKRGKWRKKTEAPIKTLTTLRSRINREVRAERALDAPNRNKIRILDELQEAILEDIGTVEAGENLKLAHQFSRELNDRFTRDAVGNLLGYEKAGGVRVPPESTLEAILPKSGGTTASVDLDQVVKAAKNDFASLPDDARVALQRNPAKTNAAIEDFLIDRFRRAAIRDGEVRAPAANTWIDNNREILDQFPAVRTRIQSAMRSQEEATRLAGSVERGTRRLKNPKYAATQRFVTAPDDAEIAVLIKSKNRVKSTREILRQVRKDKTGDALKGLKAGALEHVVTNGVEASLKDPKTLSVVKEILSPDEFKRLTQLRNELRKLDLARHARPTESGIISDVPSAMLDITGRVGSAQIGRVVAGRLGGGTVQTPGIFSGKARKFLESMTNDKAEQLLIRSMVEDPALFKALMTEEQRLARSPELQRVLNLRLNAFLAGPGATLLEEDE